ncbi:ImmA/IrrE family metallo-endopeptidase [Tabrizicola oligotrophica]|uniref:ImmA/IrrE family metallo-endopeptidase n=1 Tax=Tabrizicola oligotrophica TaxID=2710650 RepID=A0A6M0QWN4_9RHOB|nr:XRE family transcriptional regulator [Tabrizicola oligotrophica]NEY91850.1 ImmA/IrrE family metallo-endopeptidase [Tabrizicola oligotrophica]
MNIDEAINPAVLVWARETAGLSIEEAAHKIGLTSGTRGTDAEKLAAMETGERAPSQAQLAKMASAYHRPLLALYMAEPPRPADRGEDFRTMRTPVAPQEAARLDALVRDVRTRQSILRDMMEDDEDAEPINFVGTLSVRTPIQQAAGRIKAALGIEDDRGFRRGMRDPQDLFAELRRRAESLRVFVILLGDLGSHHTAISPKVFRGFAVADNLAPMIVINDQDAKAAWSFTLIHELAHIFVGNTGVSGLPTTAEPHTPNARIERFCNDVAGELLLPDQALARVPRLATIEAVMQEAETLCRDWHISKAMAAYRLWREKKTDAETYGEVVRILGEQWKRQRANDKEKNRNSESGPNYYIVRRHRLGDALLRFVGHGLRADAVTHTTAAKILGVRPGAVEPLLSSVLGLGTGAQRRKAT